MTERTTLFKLHRGEFYSFAQSCCKNCLSILGKAAEQ